MFCFLYFIKLASESLYLKKTLSGRANCYTAVRGLGKEKTILTLSSSISFCRTLSFWTICLLCESNLDSISCFASSTLQIISDLKMYFSFLSLVNMGEKKIFQIPQSPLAASQPDLYRTSLWRHDTIIHKLSSVTHSCC